MNQRLIARLQAAQRARVTDQKWVESTKILLAEAIQELESTPLSVAQAGKLGGQLVLEQHGKGFYREIGARGGSITKEKHGTEFFRENGAKGAATIVAKYGPNYFSEIGKRKRKPRSKKNQEAQAEAAPVVAAAEPRAKKATKQERKAS